MEHALMLDSDVRIGSHHSGRTASVVGTAVVSEHRILRHPRQESPVSIGELITALDGTVSNSKCMQRTRTKHENEQLPTTTSDYQRAPLITNEPK